jgi:hypothetical protein
MIVAKEKRKNNIAEYILYIWHVEELVRACNLEFSVINEKIISGYKADTATMQEIFEWYQDLVHAMINEKITVSGHLQFINKLINNLNELHTQLLKNPENLNYQKYFETARPSIELFRTKSNNLSGNDIEICLNALYSLLLMKLKKKEISIETMESMTSFSSLLSILSVYFKKLEEGKFGKK